MLSDKINSTVPSRDYINAGKLQNLHLQEDKYIKFDEVQRIKSAFAEGYLAGHVQKSRGRALNAIKITNNVVSTILLAILFVVLLGMYKYYFNFHVPILKFINNIFIKIQCLLIYLI